MSSKHRIIALLVTSSLLCFLLSNVASAQVVDPCWYGCPKDGCPQCDRGGGPIKAQDSEKRVKDCEKNHHARVEDCNNYYLPDKDPIKHRECLAKEKTLFDTCMETAN